MGRFAALAMLFGAYLLGAPLGIPAMCVIALIVYMMTPTLDRPERADFATTAEYKTAMMQYLEKFAQLTISEAEQASGRSMNLWQKVAVKRQAIVAFMSGSNTGIAGKATSAKVKASKESKKQRRQRRKVKTKFTEASQTELTL